MFIKRLQVLSTLKQIITSSNFEDVDQQAISRLLAIFFWTIIISKNLGLLIFALTSPEQTIRPLLTILIIDALFILMLILINHGKERLINTLSIGVTWLVITVFALTGGGMRAPSVIGYIVLTFLAGIPLGGWGIFGVAVLSGASGLGMAYLESAGLLPVPAAGYIPYTFWLVETTYLIILVILQYTSSQMTKASLQRAKTELAEHIKTEQTLAESERRFRALIERSPVAICVIRELVILYANPAYLNMFRLEKEKDLTGCSFLDQIAPQCHEEIMERAQKRETGLQVESMYDTKGLRTDGVTFDLLAQVTRFDLADGPATMVYLTDITKSKAIENALRFSEAKFSSAFYNSPLLLLITRVSDGVVIDVNQAFLKTFEVSRDEAINHSTMDLKLLKNEDDREYYLDFYRKGKKTIFFSDLCAETRSKKSILLSGSMNVIPIDGVDHSLMVMEDITELRRTEQALRESEERFRILVEQSPVAILISRGLEPIYTNQSMLRMIGFKDNTQAMRRSIIDYFIPTYPNESRESIAQRIISLPSPGEIEIELQREDGSRFPAQIFITSIQLSDGQANASFIINISEQKQADAKINASIQQLHSLSAHLQTVREEERAHIAREIHDELGQALTGIKMDLFWLKNRVERQEQDPRSQLFIKKLYDLLMETDLLIDNVRRISTDLRPSILDTLGLVAAIEWLARDFQSRSGIACQFHTSIISLQVPADFSTAVFRICQEALTNVARHAQASSVTIQLNRQASHLVLTIEDDGKGITDEVVIRPESLGILGMRERALMFDGQVDFETPDGGGTCVIARFPNPLVNGENHGRPGYKEGI